MARTADPQSDSLHTADGGRHRSPPNQREPAAAAVVLTPKDSGGWQPEQPGSPPDRFPGSPTTTSMTLPSTGGPAPSTAMT
jgi:hypothetical protein